MPSVWAQFSSDPHHEIYRDIDHWEGAGYIRQLPPFRPYPQQKIQEILQTIISVAPAEEQRKARQYLDSLSQHIDWAARLEHQSQTNFSTYHWKLGAGAMLQGFIGSPLIGYSTNIMVYLVQQTAIMPLLPYRTAPRHDLVIDSTGVGSLNYFFDLKASATVGKPDLYLQTGVMRRSFGPLHDDSVVYSSNAKGAPGLVFYWRGKKKKMSYTTSLFMFEAQALYRARKKDETAVAQQLIPGQFEGTASGTPGSLNGDKYLDLVKTTGRYPNKFMQLQMLSFTPLSWLEFGLFESVVWGPRFDFKYLLPFKILFHLQSIGNFPDNTLVGIYFDFRAGKSWKFPIMIYVDDIHPTDALRFLPTTKVKLAFHTAVQWTAHDSWFDSFAVEYMLVTPYMYSHTNSEKDGPYTTSPNYTNYTHAGKSIGSSLEPNSDRLTLRVRFRPMPNVNVEFRGRFSQHANASEGRLEGPENKGTIWDDGFYTHYDAANGKTAGKPSFALFPRFLGQSVIERTLQFEGYVSGLFLTGKVAELSANIAYTFEYIMNKNLEQGRTEINNYINVNIVCSFFAPKIPKRPK